MAEVKQMLSNNGIKVVEQPLASKTVVKREPPLIQTSKDSIDMAIKLGLIPEHMRNKRFDVSDIENSVRIMRVNRRFNTVNFKMYIEKLGMIVATLRMKENLKGSYLIGAPAGFGKAIFANECIQILFASGKAAVPFITLYELAGMKCEHDREALRGLKVRYREYRNTVDDVESGTVLYEDLEEISTYKPSDKDITKRYRWTDYLSADVLFVSLTTAENKFVESHTLKTIMDIRGPKGLPTVCMTYNQMAVYTSDVNLKRRVWEELFACSDEESASYFNYVHTYKRYKESIRSTSEDVDETDSDEGAAE